MRVLAVSILAITLFAPAVHAASFDCTRAATKIERMICDDAELSALDGTLGDRYVRALAKTADPDRLRTAQRTWLRDIRNACTGPVCLKAVYEARIGELTGVGMTKRAARDICRRVSRAVFDGSYSRSFHRLELGEDIEMNPGPGLQGYYPPSSSQQVKYHSVDYDADGKLEKLSVIAYRSWDDRDCSYVRHVILDIAAKGAARLPVENDLPNETQKFLVVNGEPVVVRTRANASVSQPVNAEELKLDWLAPDGTQRELCNIQISYARRFNTALADNPELCRAVAESSVDFLPWESWATDTPEGYVRERSRMSLDLDLDGEPDNILSIHIQPVCSGPHNWLAELNSDSSAITNSRLSEFLTFREYTRGRWRNWHPLPGSGRDDWDRTRIFRYDSKPYILGRRAFSRDLAAVGDTAVVSLWGGTERVWCIYKYPLLPSNVHFSMQNFRRY